MPKGQVGGGSSSAAGGGKGKARGGSLSSAPQPEPSTLACGMKFLAPEPLAAALIGKGGTVIASMRSSCSARLSLTESGEYFPNTDCRILTAQTHDEESMLEVIKQVLAKVVATVRAGSAPEAMGSEAEMRLKVLVPRAAAGGIIGKGGVKIKEMRENTGAKISINDPTGTGPGADQLVSLSGTAEALESVLEEVNTEVQTLNNEPWYPSWVSANAAASASSGYSYGKYYGGGGGGGGYGARDYYGPQSAGIDTLMRTAQALPPYVMEDSRGFALSCVVPHRLVGGLIGRGGSGIKEVQQSTGTKIGIRDIPEDPDIRSLNIAGPLANTCAAYMMMMRRYLDAEAQMSG